MTAADLIAALELPASSRVDQRVPKKLLLEHGAPTATDKRAITDGIEELFWVAALKPTTIGVAEFRDETREYLEIAVLRLTLRAGAKTPRLVELVHRAIPYPVLLVTDGSPPALSAAHIRWAQNEAGKTILADSVVSITFPSEDTDPTAQALITALSLSRQPRGTLLTIYQGWIDALLAFQASRLTNAFALPESADHRASRMAALHECESLETEITRIRAAAKKEKQLSRQVSLNLEMKRAQARLDELKKAL